MDLLNKRPKNAKNLPLIDSPSSGFHHFSSFFMAPGIPPVDRPPPQLVVPTTSKKLAKMVKRTLPVASNIQSQVRSYGSHGDFFHTRRTWPGRNMVDFVGLRHEKW